MAEPFGEASSPLTGVMPPNEFGDPAYFHLSLRPGPLTKDKYIMINLRKKTTISGLRIQTSKEKHLKRFTVDVGGLDYVEYPVQLKPIEAYPGIPMVGIDLLQID